MKPLALRRFFPAALAALLLSACGPDSDATWSDVDEGVELAQGELTVSAVLGFLNGPDATESLLDNEVGIDARAARNIVRHVRGADGTLGTSDDDLLQSIAELDAIAYVGDAAIAAIDRYATPRYGTQDTLVEGVRFSADEAALVVAICNDARLEDTRLSNLAKLKLREARPLASLAAVAATSNVGTAALTTLRDYAAALLGTTPPTPPSGGCSDTAGARDGVVFTAAEACKAVAFLNTARTSDMWRLPATSLDFVYFGGPNRPLGNGQRSRWSRLNEFTDAAGIGAATVTALHDSLASWTPGGPTTDTVADAWARRASLKDKPVRLERVIVTRVLPRTTNPTTGLIYNCGELRDGPTAPNFLVACWTMVGADSATGCQVNDCFENTVGTWVHARGLFTSSSNRSTGGYVVSLTNAPFKAAAPAP